MAKKILTLRDIVAAKIEPKEPAPALTKRSSASAVEERPPAPSDYEEPPQAYDPFRRSLRERPGRQDVVVASGELGFGSMVSVAMRWTLAYMVAIAVLAVIGGAVFVAGMLILRAVG